MPYTVPGTTAGSGTRTAGIKNPSGNRSARGVGLRINATGTKGDTVRRTLPTAHPLH